MTSKNNSSAETEPIQNIFLDTCLIQYLEQQSLKKEIVLYLNELSHRRFGFAISDVTVFELLCGATIEKENLAIETLNLFNRYDVSIETWIAASHLLTLYSDKKIPNEQISPGDSIIAATAILTGSLILTGNADDFPRPFFDAGEKRNFIYKNKKSKEVLQVIYLMVPDYEVITKLFDGRK